MDSPHDHERDFLDAIFQEAVKNKASDKHIKGFFFDTAILAPTPKQVEQGELRSAYYALAERFERVGVLRIIKPWESGLPLGDSPNVAVEIVPAEFIAFYNRRYGLKESSDAEKSISISKDGLITNQANGRNHQYGSNDKRFKFVVYLSGQKRPVSTKILLDKLNYTNVTLLSKEKREINATIFEKLGIPEFITRQGYRINPLYTVVFN
jgi:hypothetical protein